MRRHFRREFESPDLAGLLALDEAGFRRVFAGTPVERTGRSRLLRNVCVALGNAGDPQTRLALERAARDSEPLIAEHARWALRRIAS
jgi:epoxyqueuosine reductase